MSGQTTGVYPRFYVAAVLNPVATEQEGRQIFSNVERVEILIPGSAQFTKHIENVNNEHRQRWPKEYSAFKQGIEMSPDGTPIEEWPILSASQRAEMKAMGLLTVEHVRDMSDIVIQQIKMGGRRLKEAAEIFLDDAKRIAATIRLAADNDRKDAEIAALRRQIEEMGTLMNSKFTELQMMKDAPSAIATMIPGMSDPVEMAKTGQKVEAVASSLDNIGTRRKRRSAA